MVNANSPTAGAGEADSVSSVSAASACHIGGPIGVNPGELALVYGRVFEFRMQCVWNKADNITRGYFSLQMSNT